MLPKPKRVVSIPGLHSEVVNEYDNNDEKELCIDRKLFYLLMLCQTLILPSSTLFFSQSSPAFLASSLNSGDAGRGQNHFRVTYNFIEMVSVGQRIYGYLDAMAEAQHWSGVPCLSEIKLNTA